MEERTVKIIVFSQNIKLGSLQPALFNASALEKWLFVTPHELFVNERNFLVQKFGVCTFMKFADFLSDSDNEACDVDAYEIEKNDVVKYYDIIKKKKNSKIVEKIQNCYVDIEGFLCADDLGIDATVWIDSGFKQIHVDCYHIEPTNEISYKQEIKKAVTNVPILKSVLRKLTEYKRCENVTDDVYLAEYKGKKYIFIGKMDRIAYRMDLDWRKSDEEYQRIKHHRFYSKEEGQYLSTLHESGKCVVPDDLRYDVRYIQDGYLPPNYSSRYLRFKPGNVQYYAWDVIGERTFQCFNIPVSIMPFRKKLYMPVPRFKNKVKCILVATSGPGDWTAQKNRSDEDLMFLAFMDIAKRNPDVEIIYRCHPTWIHPRHNGVNSINRVAEYIQGSGLTNIHLSSNIPGEQLSSFILSFPRSSLKEDLMRADIVFGEHSVSMIDAAFEQIPFASVNLTNRRNLFCGITELGFPHCNCVDDIENVINNYSTAKFQENYILAVKKYNAITGKNE